jgi:hypothetical protein
MFELTPFVQDVIASMLAAGAFGVLVYRTVGILRPSAAEPPCTTCGSCAPSKPEGPQASTLVPLSQLRRPHASSEQSRGGIRLIG